MEVEPNVLVTCIVLLQDYTDWRPAGCLAPALFIDALQDFAFGWSAYE
jgi:hypothetical protein